MELKKIGSRIRTNGGTLEVILLTFKLVAGEGFEPSKAEPGDLQSPPIGRSGNPPGSFFYGGRKITSIF